MANSPSRADDTRNRTAPGEDRLVMELGDRDERVTAESIPDPDPADSAKIAVLQQTLWRRLTTADGPEARARAWLPLQCRMIDTATSGVVALDQAARSDRGDFRPVAVWPEDRSTPTLLAKAAELALQDRRGVVQRGGEASETACLAYPVVVGETLHGVAAIQIDASGDPRPAMRALQWGVAWLREAVQTDEARRRAAELERAGAALDLLTTVLEEDRFAAACRAMATELATRLDCERVSVGFLRHGRIRVETISHAAQFGKRMNLVRLVAGAMEEALDQRRPILYPPPDESDVHVSRAHEALARDHGAAQVLSLPMFVKDHYIGAVALEAPKGAAWTQDEVDLADCAVAASAPFLEAMRQNDRWIGTKLIASLWTQLTRLLGPAHVGRKLAVIGLASLAAVFYYATTDYRIAADAAIEGSVQRAVVAGFDGFLEEAPARAGDVVERGQLLAALDDSDLVLQRLQAITDRQRAVYAHDRALSERNRADIKIIKTQIEKADAEIRLIDARLARARFHAPFDGIVISGDHSQSIGAAVGRGELLFEIAPLDAYRLILQVDESQIADVRQGMAGQVVVSALPGAPFDFTVERITPVATAQDGRTFFRVEARLDEDLPRLRPGMRGVGKIDVAERRLIWVWSRGLLDWLRLWSWRWLDWEEPG